MDDGLIHDVSDTAFMVATYRAMETQRPDALFHDPLAGKLAGERGRKIVESEEAKKLNRPLQAPPAMRLLLTLMRVLAITSRRQGLRQSAAYVLLEPAEPTTLRQPA